MKRQRLTRRTTARMVGALGSGAVLATLGLSAFGGSQVATASASVGTATGSIKGVVSKSSVSTMLSYTGGRSGRATGSPIDIGFINSQGGPDAFPEFSVEAKSLVSLINNQLGGGSGHQLRLVTCYTANQETAGQTCAEQFLADPKMIAIIQGAMDVGSQSFHATLAGKIPVVGALPNELADATATNAYYLAGGQFGSLGLVTYAKKYLHAKTMSLMVPAGIPVATEAAAALKGAFTAAGISVKEASFSPTGTDFVSSIVASGAQTSDAFLPLIINPNQCLTVGKDLQQLKIRGSVLSFNDCLGSAVKAGLGDYPKWTYLSAAINAEAPSTSATTTAQIAAYKSWFGSLSAQVPDPPSGVTSILTALTLDKAINEAGPAPTRTSVSTKLKSISGPLFLGAPTVHFGLVPGLPDVGTLQSRFDAYLGSGHWKNATNDQWVSPPIPHH